MNVNGKCSRGWVDITHVLVGKGAKGGFFRRCVGDFSLGSKFVKFYNKINENLF